MKNFILFSISLCLLQVIIKVNAQLSPSYRKLHSAVLVEKKLYIFGGFGELNLSPENETNYNKNPDDRFFYLDVSTSFDTSNLPWRPIPDNVNNLPLGSLASIVTGGVAAGIGGVKNETIFFFNNEKDNTTSPVHSYNSPNNVWNTQSFSGVRPIGRNQMRVVTDYSGKTYLLTGFDFTVQGVKRSDGLFVCDTINLNCAIKDASVFSRLGYGVTLLPNGNLVYMGGGDRTYIPVSNGFDLIFLYDPIKDRWDSKITTGNIPPKDVGITTVLGLNGDKIILFGGFNGDNNNLYVLDTTSFEWYVPKVRGKGPVFKRGEHCANVIGKYMVVTFGSNGVVSSKYKDSGESDVLLLDISNDSEYVWTNSFDPTLPATKSASPEQLSSNPKTNTSVIVGCVVGVILLIGIISIVAFLIIKRRKNVKKAIPTPGGTDGIPSNAGIPSEQELSSRRKNVI
ncbi:unnamed protein product [Rhizophagus irregularis]|nr:unnamed protein product [Rhizophagus irregularis]